MTLAALRASGWVSKPVAIELRDNLVRALEEGAELFPGIVGYDDTVIPEVVNALRPVRKSELLMFPAAAIS